MVDHQEPNPTTNESQAPEPKRMGGFISAARRALSQALDLKSVREGLTSLDVREKKVPLEEITEQTVAGKIDRVKFDVTTILTNMGYISATPDNYQQKFPDAYRLSRIALLSLYRQGLLDLILNEEGKLNIHGEDMLYEVIDEEKLQDYLKQR